MKLEWKDPPPDRRGPQAGAHKAIAAELKAHPGRWALLFHRSRSSAYATVGHIRTGRLVHYNPPGAFEAVARPTSDNQTAIYARYIGNGEAVT